MTTFLQFLAIVICTSTGNLFLKLAALRLTQETPLYLRLLHPYTLIGLILFGSGVIFYITALGSVSLSRAQSFASSQFICTILASFVIFREIISWEQWMGMSLIAIGILLVGMK